MVLVKQDKFILGQSVSKTIASLGEEIRLDLQLQPVIPTIGATVEGTITDTNGAIITNALVKIMDSNFEPLLHAVTDSNGEYLFNNIPASSSYTIFAIAPGKKIKQGQAFALSDGTSKTINFTLEDDSAMELAIIAGDLYQSGTTTPINGAVVTLYEVGSNGLETLSAITNTNEYGQFVFREVANGNYTINMSALGFISDSISVSITTAPQIVSIQPTLQPDPNSQNGTVSGVILDNLNAPIDRADVILYRVNVDNSLTPVAFTKTNSAGVYLFINVPQGTYKVKSNELEIVELDVDPPLGQGPNLDKLTLAETNTVIPLTFKANQGVLANGAIINPSNSIAPEFVSSIGGSSGGYVILTVNVALSGEYTLGIEHLNTSQSNLVIEVNGTPTGTTYNIPSTNSLSPSDAMIFNANIDLLQGSNTIKFLGDGTSNFAPLINDITLDKNPFSGELESIDGVLENGAVITDVNGINPGFVDLIGGTNDGSVSITINAPLAGNYILGIKHLNSTTRNLAIDFNGISTGIIYTVPSTSSLALADAETFNVILSLNQGNNIIKFHGDGVNLAPMLGPIVYVQEQFLSLTEAENATLGGSASVNGEFVLNIGGTGNGYAQIIKNVPFTGVYDLILTYVANDANKTVRILVNGVDTGFIYDFEQTDSLNISDTKIKVIKITLNAGSNTIRVI